MLQLYESVATVPALAKMPPECLTSSLISCILRQFLTVNVSQIHNLPALTYVILLLAQPVSQPLPSIMLVAHSLMRLLLEIGLYDPREILDPVHNSAGVSTEARSKARE